MAEQETLGNYHASETLKILAKKKKKKERKQKHAELTLSQLWENIRSEVYSSHVNA